MLPVKDIEDFVEKNVKPDSIVHGFSHLKRTAVGAKWFAGLLGSGAEEQEVAYLAGLLHDLVRPLTEKVDHSEDSVRDAKEVLEKFRVKNALSEKVLEMVGAHSGSKSPSSPVYLADKILEQMGAYIVFRRCMFVGECLDYKDTPFKEAMEYHFGWRMKKFNPDAFPERFRKLAEHQYGWVVRFFNAFLNGEEWAVHLAKLAYENGRSHAVPFEEFVRNFEAVSEEDEEYKKETLDYMGGKKFKVFEKLIKK